MGQDYSEVVERLQAYRRVQRRTQEEMSAVMGVTQSHYAKLESGANIISYDCLKRFEKSGGDIHFLITGQHLQPGPLDYYMEQCRTEKGRLQMFRFVLWIVNLGLNLEHETGPRLPESVYKNLILAQMEQDKPENIWKRIRKLDDITQLQMAEILGMNIKRYIRLEKEVIRPDAEILHRLYSRLFYAPLLVLKPSYYYLQESNEIWESLNKDIKEDLMPMLVRAAELIRDSEESEL
ncbi:MAG: helix-turn-helix transcriptional regulator [Eubacteriales bacterium]|nr:helix-turn-helix transcriptional regulator [Eubacteriales bacterium]